MKVAIMGAGLSGLACAIELEKHGIYPTIFERRSQVGDRFINGEVFASVFVRPVTDEIRFLAEEHQLFVRPIANVSELLLYSANRSASLSGPIGFINIRGRHQDSLERQLASQVKSTIRFHSEESYEKLLREYTHIVVATGDAAYTEGIQPFQKDVGVCLSGATIAGEFKRTRVIAWFNEEFAPSGGYGFLIPFSKTEASLVLAYPEYGISSDNMKHQLWNRFLHRAMADLEQEVKIVDSFQVADYVIGKCKYPRIGNTLFVGNCFGAIMPALGFGQFSSILTGIYAARDLCGLGQYEQMTAQIRHSYDNSLIVRRLLETLDTQGIDNIIQRLDGYWGDKLIHSRVNVLKWVSYAARIATTVPGLHLPK